MINKIKKILRQAQDRGFTLVELLVVISIIAVLAAVLMANFMGARERARDAKKIQDLYALKSALRMYYNDNQRYPGVSDDTNFNLTADIGSSYMTSIVGIGYTYQRKNNGDGFLLRVGLESGAGNEDIESQEKCGVTSPVNKIFAVCAN